MARYAFSDLHGCYDVWEKIKARVQPDDELYCLGDIIDRGERGYEICLELMNRPNTHFIIGNHEMMAIKALPWLLKDQFHNHTVDQWFWNGGEKTWDNIAFQLADLSDEEFTQKVWELIDWFSEMLDQLDLVYTKENKTIHLSHAGYTIGQEDLSVVGWDRDHFWDQWPEDKPNDFIVHGHTPVQFLRLALEKGFMDPRINIDNEPATAIQYADGHKFCIDCGTIISHRAALLNLDTFKLDYV